MRECHTLAVYRKLGVLQNECNTPSTYYKTYFLIKNAFTCNVFR